MNYRSWIRLLDSLCQILVTLHHFLRGKLLLHNYVN